MQHHKWSLTELDSLMPWEKSVYVTMLLQWIEAENARREEELRKRQQ
jgi:hypothetical protein